MAQTPPEWSNAVRFPDDSTTFDGLITISCRAHPAAIAVTDGESALTFAELDRRSSALARWLVDRGVRRGTRVMLLGRRTLTTAVALLGVLRSGATCVPVDDRSDQPTVDRCLDALRPKVVLLDNASPVPALPIGQHTLCLPVELAGARADTAAPPAVHTPADVAFIMFTSGSTATPLPVCLPHRAAIQYAPPDARMADVAHEGRNPLHPGDRVLMAAPLGNRLIRELLAPWMAGATVVLAPPGREADAAHLAVLIGLAAVTVFNTVPTLLTAILATGDPGQLKSLRLIDSQGEPLPDQTQRDVLERLVCRLRNRYGATEFGPGLSHEYSLTASGDRPVLGRPAAGVAVLLLDDGRPVPPGEEGEIHIGSPGMSTGYLGMPELTAERFVPDPVNPAAGVLFRTGDIGRYRPDGVLEYVGRRDDRLTVRGYKVFVGEVERRLGELDGVRDAALVVVPAGSGGPRLVAFLVTDEPADSAVLRRRAAALLPDPGLLSGLHLVADLPVTASGKKNRSALRELALGAIPEQETGAASAVVQIVAEVIGQPVSAHDNPLDAGVNSIDAVLIAARLGTLFGVPLEPMAVLEAADLAALSATLDRGARETGGAAGGHPADAASATAVAGGV